MNDTSFDLAWGAEEIGKELNLDTRQTFYVLEKGLIPTARKIGSRWVAERGRLRSFMLEGMGGE